MSNHSAVPTPDEIWRIIKETQENIRETQESIKESRVNIRETERNIDRFFAGMEELRIGQKELQVGQKELQIGQKELQVGQKELQASHEETEKQMRKTDNRFNSQWGKLVESLVEGKLVELLKGRGIEVNQTTKRVEVFRTDSNGKTKYGEFDILALNGTEIVAVEVKTVLTPDKVRHFLAVMKDFKEYLPVYKTFTVYGAVAYLHSDSEAHKFSEKQGLFVIKATGDSASIVNRKDFQPKSFS